MSEIITSFGDLVGLLGLDIDRCILKYTKENIHKFNECRESKEELDCIEENMDCMSFSDSNDLDVCSYSTAYEKSIIIIETNRDADIEYSLLEKLDTDIGEYTPIYKNKYKVQIRNHVFNSKTNFFKTQRRKLYKSMLCYGLKISFFGMAELLLLCFRVHMFFS